MYAERFQIVMDVFRAASEVAEADRGHLLAERCAFDTGLREEVEALLRHADCSEGPLRTGAGAMPMLRKTVCIDAPRRSSGSALAEADASMPVLSGQYRILRVLGEGGMGTVYEAEQLLPRRLVALKSIRRGLASHSMARRFELEMNILARLQHPGIAQIYDAGASDAEGHGDAYFVMELVRGPSLTERAAELGVRERLDLVARVCDAVHHAHQRGVIHRDLKPGNVLVDLAGGAGPGRDMLGQPKVLDFGVATIVDAASQLCPTDASAGQIVGTLAYMSPEQLGVAADGVDVRTGVYALGVILYQVLTGRLPLDLKNQTFLEARRIVGEETPVPAGTLNPAVRGEIEAIVAHAIEKDKSRRYQSAAALAQDLRRYLAGEPIEAKRDSTLYMLRKRALLHRTALGVAAVALVCVVSFLIYVGHQADHNRKLAVSERAAKDETVVALALADREAVALRESLYVSRIHMAQAAYASSDAERMGRALDECPESQRGWEWRYLRRLADQSVRTVECFADGTSHMTLDRPSAELDGTAAGPNQRIIASHLEGDLVVLDALTGGVVLKIRHENDTLTAHASCASRDLIAVGTGSGQITLYSASSGAEVAAWRAHPDSVSAMQFSHDGQHLLTVSFGGTARLWDALSWTLRAGFATEEKVPCCAAFAPDGRTIATAGTSGVIRIWDTATCQLVRTLNGHEGTIIAIGFSRDGRRIVSGGQDSSLRIWNATDGSQVAISRAHTNKVTAVALNSDGTLAVSGGTDSTVRITDGITGKEIRRFLGHGATVTGIAFTQADTEAVSCARDGTVRWWGHVRDPADPVWAPGMGTVLAAAFSPDGSHVALASRGSAASVHDAASGSLVMTARGDGPDAESAFAIAYSNDGDRLYSGGSSGAITSWNATTGAEIGRFNGHTGWILDLKVSVADGRIASASTDSTVRVWTEHSPGPQLVLHGHSESVTSVAWRHDGRQLMSSSADGSLRIWDAETGRCEHTVMIGEGRSRKVHSAVFANSGRIAICALESGLALAFDTSTWRQACSFQGHKGPVLRLSVSADGSRLATGGFDNTVRLWDLRDGAELMTLGGHRQQVLAVQFSPDGSHLIGAAGDELRIWNAEHTVSAGNIGLPP